MRSALRIAILACSVTASLTAASPAVADGRSGVGIRIDRFVSSTLPTSRDKACSSLIGPSSTLCREFCNGRQSHSSPFCDRLRRSFTQLTRRTKFPCEAAPTPTRSPKSPTPSPTPTATATPEPSCPLEAGSYTLTQTEGGTLKPDGLPPFPFPAGGRIALDVGAPDAKCVHSAVVPFPGGFTVPTFCIAGVNFTIQVAQSGCGIGRIDSNGGSDFTIAERGDTSSPTVCALPHADCEPGLDSAAQVNVTVGDGTPDVCSAGTANALISIPVQSTIWSDVDGQCPDADGTFDPGSDTLIISLPQIFDFSTDATSADWEDLDPDGCCIAGGGPASKKTPCDPGGDGPLAGSGVCLDLSNDTVTLAASGVVPSAGVPIFDTTYTARLPNVLDGPEPLAGATCASPPEIDFEGLLTRCIH